MGWRIVLADIMAAIPIRAIWLHAVSMCSNGWRPALTVGRCTSRQYNIYHFFVPQINVHAKYPNSSRQIKEGFGITKSPL